MAAPVSAEQRTVSVDPKHDEIERLSKDIEEQRINLGLPEPQGACPAEPCAQAMSATPTAPPTRNPSCPSNQSEACTSVCTLSDSICGNATKICTIAQQLVGDAWAANKCTTASQTCKDSQDRCCACEG